MFIERDCDYAVFTEAKDAAPYVKKNWHIEWQGGFFFASCPGYGAHETAQEAAINAARMVIIMGHEPMTRELWGKIYRSARHGAQSHWF